MTTDQTSRITLDRAKSIVDAAVQAGLATPPATDADFYSYSPAWKAKLEELGAANVNALTDDQADAVEAFTEEASRS